MATGTARPESPKKGKPRTWSPRMWQGCGYFTWLRLLARNHFRVGFFYWYIALIINFVSVFNSLTGLLQKFVLGRRIRATRITEPLFVIGHWRTGTTLLHEMLVRDPRHSCPTTYECMAANHFLLTEGWIPRLFPFLVPTRRPMDNMAAGFERPQEDEFGLCMLGAGSPYLNVAFPNNPPKWLEYLDLEGLAPRALERWKGIFRYFLQCVTLRNPRRLVLKSPTHTCRIKVLLEMFPDARFVHIVRDPLVVFPSTVNLWKSLQRTHGLQKPRYEGLEEQVIQTHQHLYEKLQATRSLIPPGRFHELRYEDLVRDPEAEMERLYEVLGLSEFKTYLPHLREYLASVDGYETNKYELSPEMRAQLSQRCAAVMDRYGYGQAAADDGRHESFARARQPETSATGALSSSRD